MVTVCFDPGYNMSEPDQVAIEENTNFENSKICVGSVERALNFKPYYLSQDTAKPQSVQVTGIMLIIFTYSILY